MNSDTENLAPFSNRNLLPIRRLSSLIPLRKASRNRNVFRDTNYGISGDYFVDEHDPSVNTFQAYEQEWPPKHLRLRTGDTPTPSKKKGAKEDMFSTPQPVPIRFPISPPPEDEIRRVSNYVYFICIAYADNKTPSCFRASPVPDPPVNALDQSARRVLEAPIPRPESCRKYNTTTLNVVAGSSATLTIGLRRNTALTETSQPSQSTHLLTQPYQWPPSHMRTILTIGLFARTSPLRGCIQRRHLRSPLNASMGFIPSQSLTNILRLS